MKHSSFLVSCVRGAAKEEKPYMNPLIVPTKMRKLCILVTDVGCSHLRYASTLIDHCYACCLCHMSKEYNLQSAKTHIWRALHVDVAPSKSAKLFESMPHALV